MIKELKDVVEQKERFMSSMSHELRTPLNGIIGLSDAMLIGSCGEANDLVLKTIGTIKASGSRLLNLINDILDAASMRKVGMRYSIRGGVNTPSVTLEPRIHISLMVGRQIGFTAHLFVPCMQGKLVIKLEKVDIAKLVDDVVDLCSPLVGA